MVPPAITFPPTSTVTAEALADGPFDPPPRIICRQNSPPLLPSALTTVKSNGPPPALVIPPAMAFPSPSTVTAEAQAKSSREPLTDRRQCSTPVVPYNLTPANSLKHSGP